jgi:hypothetical protein
VELFGVIASARVYDGSDASLAWKLLIGI